MPRPSAADAVTVTPALLRDWPLPEAGGGKEQRGRTLIVGGTAETPGGALLAAEAALRSGAGKLQVATARSVAPALAIALPEAMVRGLPETSTRALSAAGVEQVRDLADSADCVLIGPGFGDPGASAALVHQLVAGLDTSLVLDALALAAVTEDPDCLADVGGKAVLTPNPSELAHSLGVAQEAIDRDPLGSCTRLVERTGAVVSLGGATSWIVGTDGQAWRDDSGSSGLGVSGSGDVRAGIVAGLLARGCEPAQAAVWAAHLHGRAGERLASTIGPLGFLARELPPLLPVLLAEIQQ